MFINTIFSFLFFRFLLQDFNCDKLQKLFGFYGDVHRVKILYTKPDNALIQFNNPTGAYPISLQFLFSSSFPFPFSLLLSHSLSFFSQSFGN